MTINSFGRDYLLLGLRMGKIIDGYVDSYWGPLTLKEIVDTEENISPKKLLEKCSELQKNLENQGFEEQRKKFLEKMLQSIETTLRVQSGEELTYLEQVKRIYDISPKLIDDAYFYEIVDKCEEIIKGTGPLEKRIQNLINRRIIPTEKVKSLYNHAFDILRAHAEKTYPNLLPEGEEFTVEIVQNQPWNAYNWYFGNSKSRIDVNIDIPSNWSQILFIAAHEGYPGHHTEHSVKDLLLYQEQERFEHCILLVQTPESVISEGLANVGLDMFYSPEEQVTIALEELCPDPSKEDSIEILIEQNKVLSLFSKLGNNLAIHAHVDGWTDKELVKYGTIFGVPKNIILQRLGFIRNPIWSTYIFTYSYGKDLITRKFGERPSAENFKMLLTQPILPSDLS